MTDEEIDRQEKREIELVSLLTRILARAEAAEKRVAYLESLMGGRASTILLAAGSRK